MGYDNTNSGALFKNKDKVEGDNRPDCTGKLNVDGKEMKLAGWWRTPNAGGDKFLSIKLSEFQEKQEQTSNQSGGSGGVSDLDDSEPF